MNAYDTCARPRHLFIGCKTKVILDTMKAKQPSSTQLSLRLSEDEYSWLIERTEDTGATLQGYIRMLIRKARKAEASA